MTRSEFIDLVRFLSELGKPGRPCRPHHPAIQRWKVLKSISADLSNSVPGSDAFRDQVLPFLAAGPWPMPRSPLLLPLGEVVPSSGAAVRLSPGEIDVSSTGPIKLLARHGPRRAIWIDGEAPVARSSAAVSMPRWPPAAHDHASGRYGRAQIEGDRVGQSLQPARPPGIRDVGRR